MQKSGMVTGMWVVIIAAVLLAAALISYYSSEDISDTLPITVCGMILLLYMLAFGRLLYAIDFISIAVLAVSAILIWRKKELCCLLLAEFFCSLI